MDNQVVSIRPAQLEVAQPGFQPSVQSSPANVYLQEVQAQTHDERRMSFTFRSPSSHLVASPLAHVTFRINVKAASKISRHEMYGAVCGVFDSAITAAGSIFSVRLTATTSTPFSSSVTSGLTLGCSGWQKPVLTASCALSGVILNCANACSSVSAVTGSGADKR